MKRLKRDDGTIDAKDVWDAVRHLTGRKREDVQIDSSSAESFNKHYASISTDPDYRAPSSKLTAAPSSAEFITEWQVFKALDCRRPTSTGLDLLPSWFLKLGAPVFSKPLAQLFNLSIATSTVPSQWKKAYYCGFLGRPSNFARIRPSCPV